MEPDSEDFDWATTQEDAIKPLNLVVTLHKDLEISGHLIAAGTYSGSLVQGPVTPSKSYWMTALLEDGESVELPIPGEKLGNDITIS